MILNIHLCFEKLKTSKNFCLGLFHKAIIQSYTSYMIKSLSTKFDLKNGFRIAARLGMNSEDPKKVADYLRTVPAEKLVECEDHLLTEYVRIYYFNTFEKKKQQPNF